MLYVLILIDCIIIVAGQICWKLGISDDSLNSLYSYFKLLYSPYIILGTFLYIVGTILWFYILSKSQLSSVYPMLSLSYVFGVFGAVVFLGEPFSLNKLLGSLIVVFGIYLLTLNN